MPPPLPPPLPSQVGKGPPCLPPEDPVLSPQVGLVRNDQKVGNDEQRNREGGSWSVCLIMLMQGLSCSSYQSKSAQTKKTTRFFIIVDGCTGYGSGGCTVLIKSITHCKKQVTDNFFQRF